jgi:exosome complex exonuclease DIS3/RRP44
MSEGDQTPIRLLTRKFGDLTPGSESESPEEKRHRSQLDELKSWFANQLEILRRDLLADNIELREEVGKLRAETAEKDRVITTLEGNIHTLSNELESMRTEMSGVREEISRLHDQNDTQEQYSRRHSLRINGIPEATLKNKNTDDIILELARSIEVPLQKSDIDRSHPVGKDKKQLIVRFTNYAAKARLYAARKNLRTLQPPSNRIFINEDLTKTRHKLVKELIDLRRRKLVGNVWTFDGRIHVMVGESRFLITCAQDIRNVLPNQGQ